MNVRIVIQHNNEMVHEPAVLPLTVALSYGPAMLKVALEAGHTVTLSPIVESRLGLES